MYTYNHSIQKTETSMTSNYIWSYPYANEFKTSPDANNSRSVYYNYRYYNPSLGRWLSRDPIGENGGYNLYAMVGNNSINEWDIFGKKSCSRAGGELKGKRCCCDGETMSPKTECCENKTIREQRECILYIYLGHWNTAPNDFIDNIPDEPEIGDTYTCVTCMSNDLNDKIAEDYPNNHIPNVPGTDDLITWKRLFKIFEAIRIHIKRNKKSLCKPCCKTIEVKVQCHKDAKDDLDRIFGKDNKQNPCSSKFRFKGRCE